MSNIFQYSAIGDNTPENREHLELLGYEKWNNFNDIGYPILKTFFLNGKWMYCEDSGNNMFALKYDGVIDCIGNPALFQAVTAMRDDRDYLQWFFSEDKCFRYIEDDVSLYVVDNMDWVSVCDFHKATLEELEEHFKI